MNYLDASVAQITGARVNWNTPIGTLSVHVLVVLQHAAYVVTDKGLVDVAPLYDLENQVK